MSEKYITIDIKPSVRVCKEAFMTPPMECPYCGGRGWVYSCRTLKAPETISCPYCQGAGEVVAFVSILWEPNIK